MERKFEFKNFVPTSSTLRYCSTKFNQIWEQSPSDSNIAARILKSSDGKYHTIIEATAADGRFASSAADAAILVSIGIATDRFKAALSQWKMSRFKAESRHVGPVDQKYLSTLIDPHQTS